MIGATKYSIFTEIYAFPQNLCTNNQTDYFGTNIYPFQQDLSFPSLTHPFNAKSIVRKSGDCFSIT